MGTIAAVQYVDIPPSARPMKMIARRLQRLAKRLRQAICAITRMIRQRPTLRKTLTRAGFVAGPVGSLADVWSRAMRSRAFEIRALLEQRAAGPLE
jgi:hypothetical protein